MKNNQDIKEQEEWVIVEDFFGRSVRNLQKLHQETVESINKQHRRLLQSITQPTIQPRSIFSFFTKNPVTDNFSAITRVINNFHGYVRDFSYFFEIKLKSLPNHEKKYWKKYRNVKIIQDSYFEILRMEIESAHFKGNGSPQEVHRINHIVNLVLDALKKFLDTFSDYLQQVQKSNIDPGQYFNIADFENGWYPPPRIELIENPKTPNKPSPEDSGWRHSIFHLSCANLNSSELPGLFI